MQRAVAWFAGNGVAANLLMAVVIGAGLLTLPTIKQEVFPEFDSDLITVNVAYLGAAPEEVEEAVCIRVEEAIWDLEGIKEISATASEGMGSVVVELVPGTDGRKVLDDIKSRVDAIDTFPEETEQPVVQEISLRRQVINVAVWGEAEERTLKLLGERVRDEIAALPGISQVELASARPYEVAIEVSEAALRRHGLTFDQVAAAVRRSSLDLPGGSVKTAAGEILLRTKGQAYRGREFEELVLLTRPDGTRLPLGAVARVDDGFADTDQSARFDGAPAVIIQVFRVGSESALAIADAVHRYVAEARARMPAGVTLTTWRDSAQVLRSRMDLLLRNGRNGLLLVFIVLALFLRFRLAFWVSIGIPISFLGAIWCMPGLDVSISLISLFAFILVLGIVVDDAIVIGENIYTHQRRTGQGRAAAIRGASEMGVPVIFAILTTVAAFTPLLRVPGTTGKVMGVIPAIVIPCLLFSLVESLLILPAHLSHYRGNGPAARGLARRWHRFQQRFADGLEWAIARAYRPSLAVALRWRYLTVAGALALLLLTGGLVAGGWIGYQFFPSIEADYIAATLTMPQGTPAAVTAEAVRRIETAALRLREETAASAAEGAGPVFTHLMAAVGEQPYRMTQNMNAGRSAAQFSGAHLGEVTLELAPAEARTVTSEEVARRWRELTGAIPDAVELSYTASIFSPGEAINVQLTGRDLAALQEVTARLKAELAAYPGVIDLTDSYRGGKQEVKLAITPAAEALGLSLADLARQVRQGFYGEEAQRIQRGRDDVKVMVRYPKAERRSLGNLEAMRIRTADGAEVPFSEVATARPGRGFATIRRVNRQRTINVTADVDPTVADGNTILGALRRRVLPALLADHPGVSYSFEGERREQQETMGGLIRGFLFAMMLIYVLLAVPLRSYLQPLIIMSAIPFGLIGAVGGHVLLGMDLTILSMFGVVALTGVVVNDNLVLVDYVNRRRGDGMALAQAVRETGAARFRPILLTSMTTFAGLTPLLLEKSVQAQFLIPMGISLAFGVMFATFISLVLVPSLYLILEDLKAVPAKLFYRSTPKPEPNLPLSSA